ncbi:hypothetical protein ABGB07_05550 [Micromonosporaceae bacterium B7E4]
MATSITGHPVGPRRQVVATYVKPALAILIGMMAIVAVSAPSAPAHASPAAAHGTAQDVEPFINERTCNAEQLPRQIWLTSESRPTRCFGGTVGSLSLNNFPVEWLSPGDYHGTIYCVGLTLRFGPAQDSLLDRTCSRLEIRPAS